MMKRCPNTSCESDFLFGNDRIACPFCHSALVDISAANQTRPAILAADQLDIHIPADEPIVPFTTQRLGRMTCRGRIVEIDRQELFASKFHKLINSLFRGEPYQLAHQTIEYTIRVENISDGIADEITDFCLFGNYLGRLQVGDEVDIRAKSRGNRRVLTALYNRTTSSEVRPGFQIPAWGIRIGIACLGLVIYALIAGIIGLFTSGAIAAGFWAIVNELIPLLIIVGGLWLMYRSVFPKRRRR